MQALAFVYGPEPVPTKDGVARSDADDLCVREVVRQGNGARYITHCDRSCKRHQSTCVPGVEQDDDAGQDAHYAFDIVKAICTDIGLGLPGSPQEGKRLPSLKGIGLHLGLGMSH
jgi:hypothetical protein